MRDAEFYIDSRRIARAHYLGEGRGNRVEFDDVEWLEVESVLEFSEFQILVYGGENTERNLQGCKIVDHCDKALAVIYLKESW